MAVYTKLNKEDLQAHLKNYDLGELIDFKGIIAGIDNSNFIISTTLGKFILTIFESRIKSQDLPFFINLTNHLSKHNICCPQPIINKDGEFLAKIKNKSSLIVTFLNGSMLEPEKSGLYSNISQDHCFEIGKVAALMHLAVKDFDCTRDNDLGIDKFLSFFNKFIHLIDDYQPNLKDKILTNIEIIKDAFNGNNLPCGVIHSDLFPDNVFFDYEDKKPKISGVIDFYFAANDNFIYDFGCIVNAWCFDENNNFVKENFDNLLQGYQSLRKFSQQEQDILKSALIAASLRFLLTRLHDLFFTPKDSLVKVKDPQEYIKKLDFFCNKL